MFFKKRKLQLSKCHDPPRALLLLHFLTSPGKVLLGSTLANLLQHILDPLGASCLQSEGHGLAARTALRLSH